VRISISFDDSEITGILIRFGEGERFELRLKYIAPQLTFTEAYDTLRRAVLDGRVHLPDAWRAAIDRGAPLI
jgi:hypothetical protein